MAKARVAPIKMMSIPRLQLNAAVISVNVSSMLTKGLAYDNIEQLYHTDLTVVLANINNDARRFHTFVGNCVQHIRDRSEQDQWYHVAGNDSPSDKASRGLTPKELVQDRQWLRGPHFLWDDTKAGDARTTVEELRLAEVIILKSLQQRYFKEEVEILQSMKAETLSTTNVKEPGRESKGSRVPVHSTG